MFATLLTLHLLRHERDILCGWCEWCGRTTTAAATDARPPTSPMSAHAAAAAGSRGNNALFRLACHLPSLLALFVITSRVRDNRHFPADVAAGSALGVVVASLTHRLAWPAPPPARQISASAGDRDSNLRELV